MRKNSLLTRRNWAALVAALPLAAQVGTPPAAVPSGTSSAPSGPSASPADDVRKTSELLAQIEIPMALEPAFAFHV